MKKLGHLLLPKRIYKRIKNKSIAFQQKRALLLLREIFDKAGIEYHLSHGTLLGAYREGKVIEGDGDIDINVLYRDNNLSKIESLLTQHGFVKASSEYLEGELIGISFLYRYLAVVNFSSIFIDAEKGTTYDYKYTGGHGSFKAYRFCYPMVTPTETLLMYGKPFKVPYQPAVYLEHCYGKSFMIPDPNWHYIKHTTDIEQTDLTIRVEDIAAVWKTRKKYAPIHMKLWLYIKDTLGRKQLPPSSNG